MHYNHTKVQKQTKFNIPLKAISRDLWRILMVPMITLLGIYTFKFTNASQFLVLASYYFFVYMYRTTALVEGKFNVKEPALLLIFHLLLVLVQYLVFFKIDFCKIIIGGLRRYIPTLNDGTATSEGHCSHGHHRHNMIPLTRMDLLKFALQNLKIFFAYYFLNKYYEKDPLGRDHTFYRANVESFNLYFLVSLTFSFLFFKPFFSVFLLAAVLTLLAANYLFFYNSYDKNAPKTYLNTPLLYTPLGCKEGPLVNLNVESTSYMITFRRFLDFFIITHTIYTSLSIHDAMTRLLFYLFYEQVVETTSLLLRFMENPRWVPRLIEQLSFNNLFRIFFLGFFHLLEHLVPVILGTQMVTVMLFYSFLELQTFFSLTTTENQLYLSI